MTYREILEAVAADAAQKLADKRRKANEKLNNERRKKTDAARQYQDRMRSAGEAERNAKATLSKLR
jgi:hypothetical protein